MSINEARRLEMHLAFREALGDEVADTLMEYLPPSGWNDLVRTRDVLEMEKRLDSRMNELEKRLDSRIDSLDDRIKATNSRLTFAITCGLTFGLALLALQVQIMLSIASL